MPTKTDSEGEQGGNEEDEVSGNDEDQDDGDDSSEEFEDEVDEKEQTNDPNEPHEEYEPTKGGSSTRLSDPEGESWKDRNMSPLIFCVCCCFCLIIMVILLGILIPRHLKKDDDSSSPVTIDVPTEAPNQAPFNPVSFPTPPPAELTPSAGRPPTLFPTISPAPSGSPITEPTPKPTDYPTIAPTISASPTKSIPDQLGILADQDTTVYLDGFYVGETYGQDQTFLVQHGLAAKQEVPDAVALLTFPLDEVPAFDRLGSTKKNAVLRLHHEPTEPARGSATYTVVRLPGTRMKVEFLHGYIFQLPEDGGDGVIVGPEFIVNPDTTVVDINVTSLLFDGDDDHQLFLMLQDRGPEQPEGGDRFYSREHPELKPVLLIDFQGGNAAQITVNTTDLPAEEGVDGEMAPSEPPREGSGNPSGPPNEGGAVEIAPTKSPGDDGPDASTSSPGSDSTESDVGDSISTNAPSSLFSGNETVLFDETNTTAAVLNQTGAENVDNLTISGSPQTVRRRILSRN
jgi:hypothetical protein